MVKKSTNRDARYISVDIYDQKKSKYVHAGYIMMTKSLEAGAGFSYAKNYNGPSLDPSQLPIKQGVSRTKSAEGNNSLHNIFKESLPGTWAAKNIKAVFPEFEQKNDAEKLFFLGSRRVNGLQFKCYDSVDKPSYLRGEELLKQIAYDAKIFEVGDKDGNHPLYLSEDAGTYHPIINTSGDAPKANYERESMGGEYTRTLAKFSMPYQPFSRKVEAAVGKMSKDAGIDTPDSYWIAGKENDGDEILIVDKFDQGNGGPRHKISLTSLMSAEGGVDMSDVANAVRRYSAKPEEDVKQLFKRSILSASVNITANSLDNFEMMIDDNNEYRLAPNYGLSPNHMPDAFVVSMVGMGSKRMAGFMSPQHIDRMSEQFGINEAEGRVMAKDVLSVVSQANSYLKNQEVSHSNRKGLLNIINKDQIDKTIDGLTKLSSLDAKKSRHYNNQDTPSP